MTIALEELLDALHRFSAAIGINAQDLQQHESPKKLRYTNTSLPATKLRGLNKASFDELLGCFGNSVSLRCSLGDLPVLRVENGSVTVGLDACRDETDHDTALNVVLELDKESLLKSWELRDDAEHIYSLFLYAASLEQILKEGLSDPRQLETSLWPKQASQVIVLLADSSIMLSGTFFAILGNRELAALGALPRVDSSAINQEILTHAACKDAVRWERPWTAFLTPRYFDFHADSDSLNEPVARLFAANGVNVSLLFTADRIYNLDSGFVASYSAANARCEVASLAPTAIDENFTIHGANITRRLASWAYEERWRKDRLRLLQVALARVLSRSESVYSCQRLLDVAEQLEQEVEWHWKTFISDAVESYVSEETELENEIAETVDGYEAQVSSMIASLSGTMLAAVGVMIGSFIAAAFKTEFNSTIFALGIIGYMVYLTLFPGIYNMLHHLIRYRTMNEIFEKRTKRFTRLLGVDATQAIIGHHVSRAQSRFRRWFGFTIIALIVVLVLAGIAAWAIPAKIRAADHAAAKVSQLEPTLPPANG